MHIMQKMPTIIPRNDLVDVWDFRWTEITQLAKEHRKSLGEALNQLSPPSYDDPGDAVARILIEKGVQLHASPYTPSTRLKDFGYTEPTSEGRILFDQYLENRFKSTVQYAKLSSLRPDTPVNERTPFRPQLVRPRYVQRLTDEDAERAGGHYWDPRTEMPRIRERQFGPSANYRDLVYDVQTVEDKVEIPKLKVPEGARRMQKTPKGTPPKLSSAYFESISEDFDRYRGGIEYDDDFLTNDEARVEVIEDFVMQFAEDFLIQLLHMTAAFYADNRSGNVVFAEGTTYAHGTDHVKGTLTIGEWDDFANSADEPYRPNRAIANRQGYRALRDIYQPEQVTLGMRRSTDPESTPEFYSLNAERESVGCAFIQGTDEETKLIRGSLGEADQQLIIGINREYSGALVFFKMRRDQDEVERHAGLEVTQRFLGTSVMFMQRDNRGVRGLVV